MEIRRAWSVGAPTRHIGTAGLLNQPPQDFREPENPDGYLAFKAVLGDDGVLDFVDHFFIPFRSF